MSHSTYLLLLLLLFFTEAVLLLIHQQAHAERTRHVRSFHQMEEDKLQAKIEGIRLSIKELQREVDNAKYELSALRSS